MWVAALVLLLGLGVALTPGPSLALICANTLRSGRGAGTATALAGTLADLAIAVLGVTILMGIGDQLRSFVGVVGAVMAFGLGLDSIVVSRRTDPVPRGNATRHRFARAFALEVSLPQALLFGLTAVGPVITHELVRNDGWWPWTLIGLFGAGLLGSRLLMVSRVTRSRRPLARGPYRRLCRMAGAALIGASIAMLVWLGPLALGLG
ncbi:hypothetical protein BH24ACT12_BH24ACT12_13120 [soil metagenome]